jgi:hypothetical protein
LPPKRQSRISLRSIRVTLAHHNFCRVHEATRTTPVVALKLTKEPWSIGELIDAALAAQPTTPPTTTPDRRGRFRVVERGKE